MKTAATGSGEGRVLQILDEYLAELRAGRAPDHAALLARHPELADSLAASLRALDFVHGAGRTLGVPAVAEPREGDEFPAGERLLGDYRLLREIGRGGMAVVYEAEQISLGRNVALKVLPFAAVLDPKQLQRFKNEAQAAAHLHHPHIVPVHAVGCDRGVHYYAMQYVEGQSLAVAIREMKEGHAGRRPHERELRPVQTCRAADHDRGEIESGEQREAHHPGIGPRASSLKGQEGVPTPARRPSSVSSSDATSIGLVR